MAIAVSKYSAFVVALRKESVDRNGFGVSAAVLIRVALRKESVDRNCPILVVIQQADRSLSARRAWIEICITGMI